MYTVDASVWVNGSNPAEPGHALSRALLNTLAARAIPLILPWLVLPEVAGAISRSRRDPLRGAAFAQTLAHLPHVAFVQLDDTNAGAVAALAARVGLRGADALYAAVAQAHSTTLISLDREHHTRLVGIVPVLTPAAALAQL